MKIKKSKVCKREGPSKRERHTQTERQTDRESNKEMNYMMLKIQKHSAQVYGFKKQKNRNLQHRYKTGEMTLK